MKSLFPSYYPLNEQELDELWNNATFVFDTNTLLNLFRVEESSAVNVLETLRAVRDRTFIPHHVALELHRNYQNITTGHKSAFEALKNKLDSSFADLTKAVNGLSIDPRHPEIDKAKLIEEINEFKNSKIEEIKDKQKNENFSLLALRLLGDLNEIYADKVGDEFSDEQLTEEKSKANDRASNGIPPGIGKDENKDLKFNHNHKEYEAKHGDYFVWKQTLDYCQQNSVNHLIFVSDERKEDWMHKEKGQVIGPRRELRDEMREAGVTHFHVYTQQRFLQEVHERNIQKISNETLEDLKSNRDRVDLLSKLNFQETLVEFDTEDFPEILESHNQSLTPLQKIDSILSTRKNLEDSSEVERQKNIEYINETYELEYLKDRYLDSKKRISYLKELRKINHEKFKNNKIDYSRYSNQDKDIAKEIRSQTIREIEDLARINTLYNQALPIMPYLPGFEL